MNQTNHRITVKTKLSGVVLYEQETGLMFDSYIKAYRLKEELQKNYDSNVVEVKIEEVG
jgi:hypothetical protein